MRGGKTESESRPVERRSLNRTDQLPGKAATPVIPVTSASIFTAVTHAIGSAGPDVAGSGVVGLPIPQILQIIASYAAPFVTTKREFTHNAGSVPLCVYDSTSILTADVSGCQLSKLSLATGTVH